MRILDQDEHREVAWFGNGPCAVHIQPSAPEIIATWGTGEHCEHSLHWLLVVECALSAATRATQSGIHPPHGTLLTLLTLPRLPPCHPLVRGLLPQSQTSSQTLDAIFVFPSTTNRRPFLSSEVNNTAQGWAVCLWCSSSWPVGHAQTHLDHALAAAEDADLISHAQLLILILDPNSTRPGWQRWP